MTVNRGKKYTHVDINGELIGNRRVTLHQRDHLSECITDFGVDMFIKETTPAKHYLLDVDVLEKLDKENILFST